MYLAPFLRPRWVGENNSEPDIPPPLADPLNRMPALLDFCCHLAHALVTISPPYLPEIMSQESAIRRHAITTGSEAAGTDMTIYIPTAELAKDLGVEASDLRDIVVANQADLAV